ncbi:MAG: MgtC/SapB family protein [Candidatus Melainabacteria bacterium]|nr:MgtC/SapB family protein [Candidatus Melainabacteria bacterium]
MDIILASSDASDFVAWVGSFFSTLDYDLISTYMPKICIAVLLGGVLGWERRARGKQAGIRTHMVLSATACLVAVCGVYLYDLTKSGDPARLAHGVLAGVGFVGAGVIFKRGLNTSGLTTSATILFSVGVGIACGLGLALVATATVLLTIFSLYCSYKLFPSFDYGGNSLRVVCRVDKFTEIRKLFGPKARADRMVNKSGQLVEVQIRTSLSLYELDSLIASLIHNDDIVAIEVLDAPSD